ncbi:hypothetical protein [Sphingomonas aerophila]|uniref:hypothetical protein n=1 Tax=Sphingomonas aerophila TaxID=1344948 RepID=UPI001C84BC35|nr:hypothetical protein [Sphingomonas aerophila]
MADGSLDADTIIAEIDAGAIRPTTHKVVRALHRHMQLQAEIQRRALDTFDRGEQSSRGAEVAQEMWAAMHPLAVDQQSGLRLSNCLVRPDEAVDWHLAEYLILWARQQGLSEQQIIEAFYSA